MELSPSSKAICCSAVQEFSNILWNRNIHCRVHKSLPQVPILNQVNPAHTIPSCFSKIRFNIILLSVSGGRFPSDFSTRTLHEFLSLLQIRSTCSIHLILVDLIVIKIFARSTNYGAHAVFSSLLLFHPSSVQIFCSAHICQIHSVCVFAFNQRPRFSPTQNYRRNNCVYKIF
jgi:hypothetical protein